MVTDLQMAYSEAGIKFGILYHQFAGAPVSPDNARSLGRAMAEAIGNQPHCESVSVRVLDDTLDAELAGSAADYTELTGRFVEVKMEINHEGVHVQTGMEMENGYPLMKIVSIE